MYKCPYCNQSTGAKTSRNKGPFTSWISVKNHINSCKLNNKEYYISLEYGPIHYSEFSNTIDVIRIKYPNIPNIWVIKRDFQRKNINIDNTIRYFWTKELIIEKIKEFYKINQRIPSLIEFDELDEYPSSSTIYRYFSSWDNAIIESGYIPEVNNNNKYGIPTIALDNIKYRSKAEAYFVNNFLYNQYRYIYELKYTNSNKLYDFYLPDLDLYIEITGGLKPEVIKEKIEINKQENKKLLVIHIEDMYKIKNTKGWVAESV